MYGFHGRLLEIDLASSQSSWRELEESRLRAFLGGLGLGTSLLYDYAPPGVEPFSPDNPLIFTSAPLVGTGLTTTAKFGVVTKSPLTGFIGDSLSSSRNGIDAVGVEYTGIAIAAHGNGFEIFRSHHRANTASPGMAAFVADRSKAHAVFTCRTDGRHPDCRSV